MPRWGATDGDIVTLPLSDTPQSKFSDSRLAAIAPLARKQLGWQGVWLPPMTLLGRRVVVVAELVPDAHAERLCLGYGPVPDRTTVATWVWPEMAERVPPPAVHIVGVLAMERHWRTGLASIVPFARFGDTALVVPGHVGLTYDYLVNCLPRAQQFGIGVLTAEPDGELTVDLPCRARQSRVQQTPVTRWLNEILYERVLAATA
jgi:hypothetical protein